nr:unnamed protein product [Callosobruchus chinensis]CAH7750987.1 unnamed protein product [Callosobruchus chinensis]
MSNKADDIDYDDPQYRITPLQSAAASCTGAVITSLLVTPLDVVKIRLQAQQKAPQTKCFLYCNGLMDHICSCTPEDPHSKWLQRPGHFNGTLDAFIKIGKTEGITSLWSGLSPTLVLAIPATIVYFVVYEQLRLKLKDTYNKQSFGEKQQPFWIPLASGATARVISASVVSPLELIRTKMQSQRLNYFEIGQALKILIETSGYKGLWRGIFPTLFRDVPFSAIYWMNYESIKSVCNGGSKVPSFGVSFFAGFISGSLAAMITTPFDVVKTHQQIEFGENKLYGNQSQRVRTTSEVFRQIYRQYGIKGLFTGTVPRVVKVAPSCAIMISSFEYGKVFFNRLAHRYSHLDDVDAAVNAKVKDAALTSNKSSFKESNLIPSHSSTTDVL